MERTKAVLFIIGFICTVCSGLPASRKGEVEEIAPVKTYGEQPIIDTGVFDGWENPFSTNPFGGLFGSLEGIMDRMRQQIASILNRLPIGRHGNSTDELLPFPGGFEHPGFPSVSGLDLSKGNTTSITKVIDGHTVVINETEYKNENDFGGTFFKVRIIDVKPDSSELTTETDAEALPENTTKKDREEIANSMENEIFKSREAEVVNNSEEPIDATLENNMDPSNMEIYKNLETFDESESFDNAADENPTESKQKSYPFGGNTEWIKHNITLEAFDTENDIIFDDDNTIPMNGDGAIKPIDLSRDIYVNEILAKNNTPINSDAEEIFDNRVVPR